MQLKERFQPKEWKVLTAEPQVNGARFSPCGQYLIAGGLDARIRRWNVATPEAAELPPLEGHHGWVHPLAFDTQRNWLFSGDSWGQLRAWPYAEDRPNTTWSVEQAHHGWLRDLDISPDGQSLASCGSDKRVRIWRTEDGTPVTELAGHDQDVFRVRFHPDGKHLLSGDDRGIVKVWDWAAGTVVRELDARILYTLNRLQDVGGVRALAVSRDGKLVACGGTVPKNGGTVQGAPTILLFDFQTGELKQTLKLGGENDCYVHEIILHEAGFVMAVTSGTPGQGKLIFQQPEDAEPFYTSTSLSNCHDLCLDREGRRLAVVATNRNSNGNGRQLDKNGKYPDNSSPIHLFEFPS